MTVVVSAYRNDVAAASQKVSVTRCTLKTFTLLRGKISIFYNVSVIHYLVDFACFIHFFSLIRDSCKQTLSYALPL